MGFGGKGGGKGGGGGGSTSINVQPSPYEEKMAQIAQEYYDVTNPLRYMFVTDFGKFLAPSQSVTSSGGLTYTPPAGGASNAPLSSNFIPSVEDITRNLKAATGMYDPSNPQSHLGPVDQSVLNSLSAIGYNPNANVPPGGTPEYDSWLADTANTLRTNALANATQARGGAATGTGNISGGSGIGGGGGSFTNLYNPYSLPAYAPLYQLARTGLESQYGQARQNILSSSARGGALAENLANLEMSRAQQAGALPASIAAPLIQDIYNKAYGAAFGAPQTSLAGFSGAESGYASRANTATSVANAAAMQGAALGQQSGMATAAGLGSLAGLGIKAAMK